MQISEFQKELKETTQLSHTDAENHPIMQTFIKGNFEKKNLLRFLSNVKSLYYVVEQRLLQQNIIFNEDLLRTSKIEKDIELLKKEFSKDELKDLLTPYECTDLWVAWCWSKPRHMLKADLYVRWLADLYGGRIMAKSMGEYKNTCSFDDPGRTISEIRDIIEKCEDGSEREEIINESVECFNYHIDLFDQIKANE